MISEVIHHLVEFFRNSFSEQPTIQGFQHLIFSFTIAISVIFSIKEIIAILIQPDISYIYSYFNKIYKKGAITASLSILILGNFILFISGGYLIYIYMLAFIIYVAYRDFIKK